MMALRLLIVMEILILFGSCGGDRGISYDGVSNSEHRIFISSLTFNGNFSGGVNGADDACNTLAAVANLLRDYKAVLSATDAASTRISIVGPVYNIDSAATRTLVATDATDLWSGPTAAIIYNETGAAVATNTHVWTGSSNSGAVHADTCSSWASSSNGVSGRYGLVGSITQSWINSASDTCDTSNRLYCISQ